MHERWSEARKEELRARWLSGGTISSIAREMNTTRGSISGQSARMHLHFANGEQRPIKPGDDADIYATTRFHSKVQPSPAFGVLKPGGYQRKLGSRVLKGKWKGFPIFSLTLEERATCPRSCQMWLSCYGNHMGRSVRYTHGTALIDAIYNDLVLLEQRYPNGFVVRLHILGDFFSVEYVQFWRDMLDEFHGLRIFGYTARNSTNDIIGWAIEQLRDERWERFAIRTSGAYACPRTKVIAKDYKENGVIVCPAQTNKTECCASCALCWEPAARNKVIAFLRH